MGHRGLEPRTISLKGSYATNCVSDPFGLNCQVASRKSGSEEEAELPNHPFSIGFFTEQVKRGNRPLEPPVAS